ncbi:hypothetical protein HK104_009226 [Borealophlyctis nickersoniae]|nr:hypothetical protein HK104_009226 [Borealophlyctis nickersoniae]
MTPGKRQRLAGRSDPPTQSVHPISTLTSAPPAVSPSFPPELVDYIIDTHLVRAYTHPTTPENKIGLKALRLLRHRTKSKAELALSSAYAWDVDPHVYECWKVAKEERNFGLERFKTFSKDVMKVYLQFMKAQKMIPSTSATVATVANV